ncbi:MAG TPA: glycosyltransferase family 87 protein [Chloroflexota bacterium]|nr:glycosyltransferase family 87 protein [Chloroflexota bacterium]
MAGTSQVVLSPSRGRSWFRRDVAVSLLLGVMIAQAVLLGVNMADQFSHPFGPVDWWTYFSSVSMLQAGHGQSLYDVPSLSAFQHSLGRETAVVYPYHPTFLLIAYPFVLLGPSLSYSGWVLFNLALMAGCLRVLAGALVPRADWRLFFLLVAASLPVYIALSTGQSSFVVCLGLTLLTIGMLRDSNLAIASGLVILLIKPQYIPVWLILILWRRKFRAIAWAATGGLVVLAASYVMVGARGLADYVRLLVSGPLSGAYSLSHTLNGLAHDVAPAGVAIYIYLLLSAVALGVYILLLKRAGHDLEPRITLSFTILVSMLVANYLVIYDLTIWAIPLALLWPAAASTRGKVVLSLAMIAPWVTQMAAQYGVGFVWPTVGLEILVLVLLYRRHRRDGPVYALVS